MDLFLKNFKTHNIYFSFLLNKIFKHEGLLWEYFINRNRDPDK